jgi:hypothetical protein
MTGSGGLPTVTSQLTTDYADNTDAQMIHEELSGKIIGAAMNVLNELKPGLDEKLYECAMIIELKHRSHIVLRLSCRAESRHL